MLIGIDGNEANVRNRVGSGQYAFELLHQFSRLDNYPSSLSVKLGVNSSREVMSSRSEAIGSSSSRQARTIYRFIIYLKESPLPDLPAESENFRYKIFGPKKFWTQFALPIRLIHGSDLDVFFSMAHYGPRFSKVPYVVTIHDLSFLHYPKLFKKNDLYQLTNWTKYSVKNSAHIIAVSQKTRDDIIKNYHVDPSKITVTYEGYDKERFKPQPKSAIEKIKNRYKIKGDYILFVGTLQPRKNLERLIEAFNRLTTPSTSEVGSDSSEVSKPALKLVICGKKGWMYDQIFEKVKILDLEQKVIFTDYVPDDDLPALISGAQVYVLPSLWEGFGIPVIEAQACGVPVVVSGTSSLPEIVGAEPDTSEAGADSSEVKGSGVLINPLSSNSIAAGIKKALDQKVQSDLINRGYQNIKRFTWQNCARETLQVLAKVASK